MVDLEAVAADTDNNVETTAEGEEVTEAEADVDRGGVGAEDEVLEERTKR